MAKYAPLTDFIAYVKQQGFVQASHFNVVIGGAPAGEINVRDVMMLCENTNLPGINIFTNEVRTFGEAREVSYSAGYGALQMTFLMDRNMLVRQYFEQWTNQVFDRETREIGFYRNYVRDMEIYITDREGKPVHSMRLFECYPKAIGEVSLDYNSRDILRLPVTIVFKYWENMFGGNANNRRNMITDLTPISTRGSVATPPFLPQGITVGSPAQGLQLPGVSGSIGARLSSTGISLGSDIARVSNSTAASIFTSDLPSSLGNSIKNLGNNFTTFGSGIDALGQGLSAITGPVQSISNVAGTIAGTFGAIDSTLSALGLGTPFSGVQNKLNNVSGQLAVVSQLRGVPGHLSTIGSTMSSASGVFDQLSRQIEGIPGATAKVREGFSKMSSVFSRQGDNLSTASSDLASEVEQQ